MASRISRSTIEKADAKKKPYEISGQHGLVLRVQPSGKKSFYCVFGRGKRMWLGDATVVTLQRAEYRAREILNEVNDTGSPVRRDVKKATLGTFIESTYTPWLKANR